MRWSNRSPVEAPPHHTGKTTAGITAHPGCRSTPTIIQVTSFSPAAARRTQSHPEPCRREVQRLTGLQHRSSKYPPAATAHTRQTCRRRHPGRNRRPLTRLTPHASRNRRMCGVTVNRKAITCRATPRDRPRSLGRARRTPAQKSPKEEPVAWHHSREQ